MSNHHFASYFLHTKDPSSILFYLKLAKHCVFCPIQRPEANIRVVFGVLKYTRCQNESGCADGLGVKSADILFVEVYPALFFLCKHCHCHLNKLKSGNFLGTAIRLPTALRIRASIYLLLMGACFILTVNEKELIM